MIERPDKKKRLSVYLDPDLMRRLADFASGLTLHPVGQH